MTGVQCSGARAATGRRTEAQEVEPIKKALDEMGQRVSETISSLRSEFRNEFEHAHAAMTDQREAMIRQDEAMDRQQELMARQQEEMARQKEAIAHQQDAMARLQTTVARQVHVLDQGMARLDDDFRQHRENVGVIVLTYVEDLHAVKADLKDVRARLDVLEQRVPPAA
jgi:hypothetical protein